MGGRADPSMVRHGATEAVVEGRFVVDGDEVVLRRVVPADGSVAGLRRRAPGHRRRPVRARCRPGRPARPARPPVAAGPGGAARRARPVRRRRPGAAGRPARSWPGGRPRAGRARRRRAGPGPRDRPAALPGRRDRRPPGSTIPTRTSAWPSSEDTLADALAHQEAALAALAALDADDGAVGRAGPGRWPRSTAGRRSPRLVARLRGLEAELVDVAARVRAVGRVDRGRPGPAGRGAAAPAAAPRAARASTATPWPR